MNRVLLILTIIGLIVVGCDGDGEDVTPAITQTPGITNTPSPAITNDIVVFPELNLELAVRWAIGKPKGEITESDLEGLVRFYVPSRYRNIRDLTGIENAPA